MCTFCTSTCLSVLLNVQFYFMLVTCEENIITNKIIINKKKFRQELHKAHIHVFSALAKTVPSSAWATSAKSSQADGSNERSAEIIQYWTSLTFTCGREQQSLIHAVLDSNTTHHLRRVRGGWMKRNGWVWWKKKNKRKNNMSRRIAPLQVGVCVCVWHRRELYKDGYCKLIWICLASSHTPPFCWMLSANRSFHISLPSLGTP